MIHGCTAYDLIVVVRTDSDTVSPDSAVSTGTTSNASKNAVQGSISCSECMFRFGTKYSSSDELACKQRQHHYSVFLVIHDQNSGDMKRFPISSNNTIQTEISSSESECVQTQVHDPIALQNFVDALRTGIDGVTGGSGPFNANFILISTDDNDTSKETIIGIAPFHIYVYHRDTTNLAIVDVDGTITTSTLSGFWNTAILHDYSPDHCHSGVCEFLTNFVAKSSSSKSSTGIQLLYLTNRPISYVDATRNLLVELHQDGYHLPKGPLIGFCGGLAGVFKVRSIQSIQIFRLLPHRC
jgi:LNS2 (Lipin/Ned1/Smp2)